MRKRCAPLTWSPARLLRQRVKSERGGARCRADLQISQTRLRPTTCADLSCACAAVAPVAPAAVVAGVLVAVEGAAGVAAAEAGVAAGVEDAAADVAAAAAVVVTRHLRAWVIERQLACCMFWYALVPVCGFCHPRMRFLCAHLVARMHARVCA